MTRTPRICTIGSRRLFGQLGNLLLDELASAIADRTAGTHGPPTSLRRMDQYARQHFHEQLTVDAIARVGACSRATAHRLFRSRLGASPYQFAGRLRTEAARQLLRTTGLPVADIARQVGFDDPYHFSRFFKNATGVSPQHYRNAGPYL